VAELLLASRRGAPRDPLVNAALRAIGGSPERVRIGALAAQVGVGQDTLEKRFRRGVGATPKQLASILRLRHAVEGYQRQPSLTRLALDAGYFDQSHFVRALRSATGESPRRFFGAARWC
jgi:methylphosphotriester-DNA--protein-cysteine methyltransferase